MYAEFAAAVQSLNSLATLIKTANGLSNYSELVAAVSEVSTKLLAANAVALGSQEKQAALSSEIAELKEKLRKLERFEHEAERYTLEKLSFGGLVFSLKKGMENGQPPHYLCATCMNKGEITFLQPEGEIFVSCPLGHGRIQVMAPNNDPIVYPDNGYA